MRSRVSIVAAALFLALVSFSAVSVDRLKAHVTWLADPAREGRQAGTAGADAAAQYISKAFTDLEGHVQFQDFGGRRKNVVAKVGDAGRYILIGAHYD